MSEDVHIYCVPLCGAGVKAAWWRRKCLRKAKAGTTPPRCWQHEGLT